jgi:hypothetical protein
MEALKELPGRIESSRGNEDTRAMDQWQSRLLPLMIRMLVGLTVFFFLASLIQLVYLHTSIREGPRLDVVDLMVGEGGEDGLAADLRALVILESNALERRYHQANVLLMSRVWRRYLGFVTGMILALVGAAFILGKLREEVSDVELKSTAAALNLKSTSPGLVLTVLGVVLMIATIVTHHEITIADTPVYVRQAAVTAKPSLGDSLTGDREQPTRPFP